MVRQVKIYFFKVDSKWEAHIYLNGEKHRAITGAPKISDLMAVLATEPDLIELIDSAHTIEIIK